MKHNIFNKKHYTIIQNLKESKVKPILPFALLIAFLIFYIASKLSAIPMLLFTSIIFIINGLNFTIIYSFQKLIIPFATLILVMFLWVKFAERRNFSDLGFKKNNWQKKLLYGFGIGFFIISLTSTFILLFKGATFESDTFFSINSFLGFIFLLLGFIIEGFSKEILTRGWLLPVISKRHNIQFGILFSSIFFVVIHIFKANISFIAILNLFLFSIFASLYTLKNDSLWEMSALHGAWNFTQATVFGFNVHGEKVIGGSFFNFKTKGLDLISGGQYGIDASILISLSLLISIFIVYKQSTKVYTVKHKKKMD